MKQKAIFLTAMGVLFIAAQAQGQGFRSFGAAPAGGRGQANASSRSVSQPAQGMRGFAAPGAASQTLHSGRPSGSVVIRQGFSGRAGSGVMAPSAALRNPPVFGFKKEAFHHHRRPPFPDHRGILIIEVPSFSTTTVSTNFAPAGGWVEKGVAEDSSGGSRLRSPEQLAPFDPTPQEVVERMLALASVKKGDVVYDLGSGDGRVVITAAKKYRVKAVGYEIDPGLIKLARENARKNSVEKLVEFRQQDFAVADLSKATVVTLYLSYDGNLALRPKLLRELKPGARVVSYGFDMGDWPPKITESYRDAGGDTHLLYLWQIADRILNVSSAQSER